MRHSCHESFLALMTQLSCTLPTWHLLRNGAPFQLGRRLPAARPVWLEHLHLWWNTWIITPANLQRGSDFIFQPWQLYFLHFRILCNSPPLPTISLCYIPPLSRCFCNFTHLHSLFTQWRCQLNGAGLVSSVSSRASVSMQGVCLHLHIWIIWLLSFHINRSLSVRLGELSCPGISVYICSLQVRSHGHQRSVSHELLAQ